jgi:asparagine synthase (glutamine-hydrolysing)
MKNTRPESIRMRKDKIGFDTPQSAWFKEKPFQDYIQDIILSDSFKNRNIINPKKAEQLYQNHLYGKINISKEIWKWIHLEQWFRKFVD